MSNPEDLKMPNPNPVQTEDFKKHRFPAATDIPSDVTLAKKPQMVKLPVGVSDAINELGKGKKSVWLRRVICEAAIREGLIDEIR